VRFESLEWIFDTQSEHYNFNLRQAMKRREFVKAGVATWVSSALSTTEGQGQEKHPQPVASSGENRIGIENSFYGLEVDRERGLILQVLDKKSGVELIAEPRLADNFRLLLPLADLEANYILGREQRTASVEKTANGLTLSWKGPLKNHRGNFDLDVFLRITFVDQSIEFLLDVRNRTEYLLAEVWYPILGGITGIGDRKDTQEMIPYSAKSTETSLFYDFPGRPTGGGLGVTYVEQLWSYPAPMPMPWISLQNRRLNRSMYFACHDTVCRYKSVHFELHPGIGSRQRQYGGNWPRAEELDPKFPLGLKLHWAQFPYSRSGETFEGPPVVLQFHSGDWHDSAMIYRQWFKSNFPILDPAKSWMRQEYACVDTMVLLPEGDIVLKFKDIPGWAKATLDNGVKSVLVSGWSVGGHDASYPYYEPDPRLGTWDDLAAGIQECHQMGVKVFFFVNIQPVRVDTDWYRQELHRYVSMDKWGVHYPVYGWGMETLAAKLGYTRVPLISACTGIPQFRKIIVEKMVKLAQIGADGLHIDKFGGGGLDFNPLSTLGPDQATSEGRLLALDEILKACRAVNPEFALSTESAWDRTLTYSNVAWLWHGHLEDYAPVLKYTFPEWLPGLGVPQPYDYTPVNDAVRYGWKMFVGPGNFVAPDSMDFGPMKSLSAYIKEMLRILEGLKDTILYGDFIDDLQVRFEGPEGTRYSVFRNPRTGKRACVVVNLGDGTREAVVRGFDGNDSGAVRLYQPFENTRAAKLPARVTIPSERLLIVAEE
jgi:Domain of unknown function (DUF6259)